MYLKQNNFSPHLWTDISWQLKFQALSTELAKKKMSSLYIQSANSYFTETVAVKTISIALEIGVQTPPHPTKLPGSCEPGLQHFKWGHLSVKKYKNPSP